MVNIESVSVICVLYFVGIKNVYGIIFDPQNMVDELKNYYLGNIYPINTEFPYSKGKIVDGEEFDFIIIGSGSAGSVVASRLSEISEWKILLLEIGKPENLITDVPGSCIFLQQTDYNWNYKMQPQDNLCLGMKDRQCAWPRGKALGGSSVINYMIYTRGNKRDFDRWAEQGNPGWSWDEVLPYYIRSENANLKNGDEGYHGKDGYLDVEDLRYHTPLADLFLKAGEETGRRIVDYNGKTHFGFSHVQSSTRRGARCSVAKAFLQPAKNRPNLRILPMSWVTKILINTDTKIAYGVEYLRNRKAYTAISKKEIILSAGPIASPQLLMLSGIGPKNHLNELKIPLIHNLNVGQYLQDHLSFLGMTFLINESYSLSLNRINTLENNLIYTFNQTGPLVSIGGVEGIAYIKTNVSKETDDYPDIELIFLAGSINSDGGSAFKQSLHLTDAFYDEVYSPINYKDTWTIVPMLLHPKSTGYMKLKSRNPFHHPLLYGDYLSDPENEDVKTLLAAIKEIIKLSETKAFQEVGSILHNIPVPGCKMFQFASDDYWKCAIRYISSTLHHQLGTCKMGPTSDPNAVVDAKLKVHGVQRIRVVDSSVIPFALSAHTNAPAIMIGEKASDIIKSEYGKL